MILFLDQASNRKHAINENYARELMELFTLGADRGAYTEHDVRELARSLSGWRYDWSGELGAHNFHWDEQDRWDPGYKTVFGKTRALDVGGRLRGWSSTTACTRRSSSRSCGATSSRRRPTRTRAAKLEALYKGSGYEIRPVLEAILCSPALYEGPRMVKPPMVLHRRHAARPQARRSPRTAGRGCSDGAGQRALLPAGRRGLGRQALARHQHHARALGGGRGRARRRHRGARLERLPGGDRRPRPWRRRARSGATPTLTAAAVTALHGFANAAIPSTAAPWLRAQRQNALRQLIAGSPDYQTS